MHYVYLDSQHISRLAQGGLSVVELNHPDVSVVISAAHIVEAMPKDETSKHYSIDRMRALSRHTRTVFVQSFFEIPKLEHKRTLHFGDLLCGPEDFLLKDFEMYTRRKAEREIAVSLRSTIAEFKDLEVRRKMKSKFFRHGRLRVEAIAGSLSRLQPPDEQLPDLTFPEAGELQRTLIDLLLGRVGQVESNRRLRRLIISPVMLASAYGLGDLDLDPLSRHFWTMAEEVNLRIDRAIRQIAELSELIGVRIEKRERDYISRRFTEGDIDIKIASQLAEHEVTKQDLEHMVGTRAFLAALLYKIRNVVRTRLPEADVNESSSSQSVSSFKRSDYGDAVHCVYMPYVDVFCCDKRTKLALKSAFIPCKEVCSTDHELRTALQRLVTT